MTNTKPKILVLGDSHPKNAIDPRYLNGSFNLSSSGETAIATYYRLRYYLDKEDLNVEIVLLPPDLHNFTSFRIDHFVSPVFGRKYIKHFEIGKVTGQPLRFFELQLSGECVYAGGITSVFDIPQIRSGMMEGQAQLLKFQGKH